MKRILALFLSAALLLALLCACGGSADPEITVVPPSESTGESASVPPESTPSPEPSAEPSEEPTEEVTAEPSQEPSQAPSVQPTPAPTPTPTPKPTPAPTPTPKPTPSPEPSPTVPGGGIIIPGLGGGTGTPTDAPGEDPNGFTRPTGPSASDVNMTNFYQTVLSNYAFPEMGEYDGEWVANYYPGLLSIPVVQRLVIAPRMTGNAAEIVLVQVADGSDVAAVKSILQARIDRGKNDFNYPQVTEAWRDNSRVVSSGNYIMLVVHSEHEAIIADFNALF